MNYYNVFFYGNNEPKTVLGHSLDTVMNEYTEMFGDDTVERVEPVSIHQKEKEFTQRGAQVSVLTGYNPFAGRLSEAEEKAKKEEEQPKKDDKGNVTINVGGDSSDDGEDEAEAKTAEADSNVKIDDNSPDANEDGVVDAKDDLNKDGKVDAKDLKIAELEKDLRIKQLEKEIEETDDPAPEVKMKKASRLRIKDRGNSFECIDEKGKCVKSFPYDNKETFAKAARYDAQRFAEKHYAKQLGEDFDLEESTKEYAKTLSQMADKAKKDKITSKDLETLSKLAQLMKTANEDLEVQDLEEKKAFIYAAAQARKEGKKKFTFNGKEYPVTIKADLGEASIQLVARDLEKYAKKSGGIDKKDFMKAAEMMKSNQKAALVKFVDDLDTEPRDKIIHMVAQMMGYKTAEKMFNTRIREENILSEGVDKKVLKMLKDLDTEEAIMIINGMPKKDQRAYRKALGIKEMVDGRTKAYRETAARLMAKKQSKAELEESDDPCWEGYEMVGMKMKDGKEVPNCVPVDEARVMREEELKKIREDLEAGKLFEIKKITNIKDVDSLNDMALYLSWLDGKADYDELSKNLQNLQTYKMSMEKMPKNVSINSKNWERIRKGIGGKISGSGDDLRALTNRIMKEEILKEAGYNDQPKTKAEADKKYPDVETDVKNKESIELQKVKVSEVYANYISLTNKK